MSIKRRIAAFQLIVTLAVVAMAVATYVGIRSTSQEFDRMQLSRQHLDAITKLAVHVNRFSEQIAELLLLGEAERPEFEAARADTDAAFEELRRQALAELEIFPNDAANGRSGASLARVDEMYNLFREIDRATERVLLLDQQGRRDEAIALFRDEIENRLDAELERQIGQAAAVENQRVANADRDAQAVTRAVMIATLVLLIALLVVTLGSGYLFARALSAPIAAISQGASAIGRGEFGHRIAYDKANELGHLARRFNAMADELQQQRAALLAGQQDLEHQVIQRTRELAEANSKLEELDRKRVRLLADVSHELRTPLTVLRGEAEVTLRGASKPENVYRAALSAIVSQAADMGNLIDDLLFLSRVEAEDLRFEFRAVSLSKVASDALQDAAVLARNRNVPIALEDMPDEPVVRADPRRLKQALLIVLDNAVKYADPQRGVTVHIGRGESNAEIRVRDHGVGVPAEEIPHVFRRFYRGARGERTGGSGLGLPIARWIVEKHQGRIELSSAPGEGAEVRISLPLVAAA